MMLLQYCATSSVLALAVPTLPESAFTQLSSLALETATLV
jgi:hypothetical protein